MDYAKKSDNDLVTLANGGDTQAIGVLIERNKGLIRSIARSMYLAGGDVEDLIQEGTLGILKAISSYNGKSSFKSYAFICIKSSMISAVRKINSKKNLPLKNYISLTELNVENNDKTGVMLSEISDPETDYINKEAMEELKESIKESLSKYEYDILSLYLSGISMEEISSTLLKNQKSIENALHRIRKKIEKKINN